MSFKFIQGTPEGTEPYQMEVEVSLATFTTTSTSVTVRTRLARVEAGFVNLVNDPTIPTDATADFSVPIGAVSNGAITVSRSSQVPISGAVVCVMLIGSKTAVG